MVLVVTLAMAVAGGALFGFWVAVDRLSDTLQPMITVLSIMAAAVLVRLNRGMPTIDWKSVDPSQKAKLTARIVGVTYEYVVILGVLSVTLVYFLALMLTGKACLVAAPGNAAFSIISGILTGVCIARMSYVVWRDYDIVKLQKQVIDQVATKEVATQAVEQAEAKLAAMRGAREGRSPSDDTTVRPLD